MAQQDRFSRLIVGAYTDEAAPAFTMERHIARARREMGEDRWAELSAEWSASPSTLTVLTEALGELNATPGTITDLQQARALERILARRGYSVVEGRAHV